jgi:hypothetical protein
MQGHLRSQVNSPLLVKRGEVHGVLHPSGALMPELRAINSMMSPDDTNREPNQSIFPADLLQSL